MNYEQAKKNFKAANEAYQAAIRTGADTDTLHRLLDAMDLASTELSNASPFSRSYGLQAAVSAYAAGRVQ